MNTQTKNSLLLLLCSLIWGTAFVAQSAGSGMGAYSFLAGRSWLAVLVLIPTVMVFDAIRRKSGTDAKPKTAAEKKKLLAAGFVCGTLLFAASAAQQIGITINPSTAKAGFLTAMYVVLVPVFGLFLGRKGSAQLWVSMAVAVWKKVDGGAEYVADSTYYICTDGTNYRCTISGLDPAAQYRVTISYDSSKYYLYGLLKVEGIG